MIVCIVCLDAAAYAHRMYNVLVIALTKRSAHRLAKSGCSHFITKQADLWVDDGCLVDDVCLPDIESCASSGTRTVH